MALFRNREIKKFTFLMAVICAIAIITGFLIGTITGILTAILCGIFCAVFFVFTKRRYKDIAFFMRTNRYCPARKGYI